MRLVFLMVLVYSAVMVNAQDAGKKDPPKFARLCGKLQHSEQVPVKNAKNTFEDRVRDLPHVTVRLYSAQQDRECCDGMPLTAQTVTGHWGAFRFDTKNLMSGFYWLVIQTNGREYKMHVQYDPRLKSGDLCSETFWELNDAGRFWISESITVD